MTVVPVPVVMVDVVPEAVEFIRAGIAPLPTEYIFYLALRGGNGGFRREILALSVIHFLLRNQAGLTLGNFTQTHLVQHFLDSLGANTTSVG